MNRFLSAGAVAAATATLLTIPATAAHADDDFKKRSGSCSQGAKYTMTLRDAGDDPDRLRATFFINSTKANRVWRFTVKRGDRVVHRERKRTNRRGNVFVADTFRGDDDARVRVIARSGYGESCSRALRLDD